MSLIADVLRVRKQTERLCAPLAVEDYVVQSMADASPTKWHLAHTSWFFEAFVIDGPPYKEGWGALHNSYYEGKGPRYERARRGILTRPTVGEVYAYRHHVDARIADLTSPTPQQLRALTIGMHHEQQHQELILTDIKHAFAQNPLFPAYRSNGSAPSRAGGQARPLAWHECPGGLVSIGHEGGGFFFDNEAPRHRVYIAPFELATRLVTWGEYAEFIGDHGYARPELWLSDGWAAVQRNSWRAPLYAGAETLFTLDGMRELDASEPVVHVSYFEADAYARWAGARLPTEAEWELCATHGASGASNGAMLEDERLHPAPSPANGLSQMLGDAWEWTQSAYAPYPGYKSLEGTLGEYNGKFMVNQLVLRGGSCITPRSHIRVTYRNFFGPEARWQFSGIRLARSR